MSIFSKTVRTNFIFNFLEKTPCNPNPCNEGTCEVVLGLVKCTCPAGRGGVLCELILREVSQEKISKKKLIYFNL